MNFEDKTDNQLLFLQTQLNEEIEKRNRERNLVKLEKQREELKSDRFKNFIKDVKKLEDKVRAVKPSKFTLNIPIEFTLWHYRNSVQDSLYENLKIVEDIQDGEVQLKIGKNHGMTKTQVRIINEWLQQNIVCIEGAIKIGGGFKQVFPEIAEAETELVRLGKEYDFFVDRGLEEEVVNALENS